MTQHVEGGHTGPNKACARTTKQARTGHQLPQQPGHVVGFSGKEKGMAEWCLATNDSVFSPLTSGSTDHHAGARGCASDVGAPRPAHRGACQHQTGVGGAENPDEHVERMEHNLVVGSEMVGDMVGVTVGSEVVGERDGESVGSQRWSATRKATTWDQSWLATATATMWNVGSDGFAERKIKGMR